MSSLNPQETDELSKRFPQELRSYLAQRLNPTETNNEDNSYDDAFPSTDRTRRTVYGKMQTELSRLGLGIVKSGRKLHELDGVQATEGHTTKTTVKTRDVFKPMRLGTIVLPSRIEWAEFPEGQQTASNLLIITLNYSHTFRKETLQSIHISADNLAVDVSLTPDYNPTEREMPFADQAISIIKACTAKVQE